LKLRRFGWTTEALCLAAEPPVRWAATVAYARHSHGSNWYIFSTGPDPGSIEEEELAIYHVSAMEPWEHENNLIWTYAELREMKERGDFSAIPGAQDQTELLLDCIRQFMEACEAEWRERDAARSLPVGRRPTSGCS